MRYLGISKYFFCSPEWTGLLQKNLHIYSIVIRQLMFNLDGPCSGRQSLKGNSQFHSHSELVTNEPGCARRKYLRCNSTKYIITGHLT